MEAGNRQFLREINLILLVPKSLSFNLFKSLKANVEFLFPDLLIFKLNWTSRGGKTWRIELEKGMKLREVREKENLLEI